MVDYNKYKKQSNLKHLDVNNLYNWAISQKLSVNDFKWVEYLSKSNEDFVKSYSDESDEGYFLEVDVQYPENLHNLHNGLHFFPKGMKIEKVDKLIANLYDKEEYVIRIRNLKQASSYGLVMKKFHRVIKFNQKA